MAASLTDKPEQWNPKHAGGHQSIRYNENKDTVRSAKGMLGFTNVKTGCSIHVQMPKPTMAIPISVDSESNEEQEQVLKQWPEDKQPVVEIDEDADDEDENH